VFDIRRLEPRLGRIHDRLAGVVIEQLDWSEFLPRYDRPGTIFYLDPPYWGSEDDYGSGLFGREDFARLAAALEGLQGRVLLSINDRPEVRALFAWADQVAVETRYSIGGPEVAAELLIGKGLDLAAAAPARRLL